MRVHAIQTGRLEGNETVMRGRGWSALFRRRQRYQFPVLSFVLEHPDGLIAVDTGLTTRVTVPATQRLMSVPTPLIDSREEIEPRMREAGLAPEDVRKVVITHLDWDHTGGLASFPGAEILVHRPEHEFASKLFGKLRYQPKLWPSSFDPTLYDLEPEPFGPFSASKPVTESGDVRLVPIPGHSIGQVGVIADTNGPALFFAADHVLRQDWFIEDYAAGNLLGLGALFFPKQAVETSRRIRSFIDETPTVLVLSHDSESPSRLEAREQLKV